ncbi:hypothetical protein [Bdellovibrio sp. KM01]|uniref:hypothetical protein n=1 Tax=Bdellovibrio sp. KM01 TaxID=2748865 RepID=UPI0015E90585|nr:hypothetical protein [Bdellovibrio sp. KM01]QLY23987.1 hypothetical protein HW988_10905 [Bdellovibrio sp. KM01]
MKSVIALIAILGVTSTTFAAGVSIEKIAKEIKENDTRTVIKVVTNNQDQNPCLPDGESYIVEIQVKKAGWDPINTKIVYKWTTEKTISVDKEGRKMEVCAE